VSNQIASLVQNISASARSQSTAAQNIARNMQVLREISAQSADSTSATSHAIAKLADLSASLRKSITGFRLPGGNEMSGRHRTLPDPAATQSAKSAAGGAPAPAAPGATGAYANPKVKVLGGS
jgi:ABC-type transporter Mla subunit MlaD